MRYVVQHKKSFLINLLVVLFSIGIYFFLVSFGIYKYLSEEFFPRQILNAVKGNPEIFLEPKSMVSIMESVHMELFLLLTAYLSVFSIFIRTSFKDSLKAFFLFIGAFSIFLYFLSIFAVRYLSDFFAEIYFFSLLFLIFYFLIINTLNLYSFLTGKIK